jgi:hypothetical protein
MSAQEIFAVHKISKQLKEQYHAVPAKLGLAGSRDNQLMVDGLSRFSYIIVSLTSIFCTFLHGFCEGWHF